MKYGSLLSILALVIFFGWWIGSAMDRDALMLILGMLIGMTSGIPTALLMIASQRREAEKAVGHAPQQPMIYFMGGDNGGYASNQNGFQTYPIAPSHQITDSSGVEYESWN